jgi:glucose-1-phosphate thymidylyltransferase
LGTGSAASGHEATLTAGGGVEIFATLKRLPRGELEITDVNPRYMERGALKEELLGCGIALLDTGTHQSLLLAATFIEAITTRQGQKVYCPEEIAFRSGYIDSRQLELLARPLEKTGHGTYLLEIALGQS